MGVDIGGTKVLAAVLDDHGVISEQVRFPTPPDYDEFLAELSKSVEQFTTHDFRAAGVAAPTNQLDRDNGIARSFGNLPWKNVHLTRDIEHILDCPVALENDAKLGGLSEAMLLQDKFQKVLYVTVSTGIGIALIDHQRIVVGVGDGGGHNLYMNHQGKMAIWESFASGHAIVERYGKMAKDIDDETTWKAICRNLAPGISEFIAVLEPEVVVIGGSVGTYFDRYGKLLEAELKKYEVPLARIPKLLGAARAEQAVVYGCYDYAKQVYGHAKAAR